MNRIAIFQAVAAGQCSPKERSFRPAILPATLNVGDLVGMGADTRCQIIQVNQYAPVGLTQQFEGFDLYQVALDGVSVPAQEQWVSAAAEPDEASYVCLGDAQEELEIGVTVTTYLPQAGRYEIFRSLSANAPYQQCLVAWWEVPAIV